jgi:hypothetical protein
MAQRSPQTKSSTKPLWLRAQIAIPIALAIAACSTGPNDDGSVTSADELSVACPSKIAAWAIGTAYHVGDLVTFKGTVFRNIQAHTAEDGWFPDIVPALWQPVTCNGSAPAPKPAPTTAPTTPPPPAATTPPPPPPVSGGGNNGGQCVGGPKFDPAGAKNVGNGHAGQFIGGQCLSSADCASGCCAKPCGICSGPGAQFQAGKQGCGFGGP